MRKLPRKCAQTGALWVLLQGGRSGNTKVFGSLRKGRKWKPLGEHPFWGLNAPWSLRERRLAAHRTELQCSEESWGGVCQPLKPCSI